MKKTKTTNNIGFVLLFSLLISSILLAAGLGISRLMVRQINLASLSRESQVAFFASDSGIECALHWYYFASFDPVKNPNIPEKKNRAIFCNGQAIRNGFAGVIPATKLSCDAQGEPPATNKIDGSLDPIDNSIKSCFTFSLSPDLSSLDPLNPVVNPIALRNQPCAFVVVNELINGSFKTIKITSNGYNRCDLSLPNTLQRTLEINLSECVASPGTVCTQ